MSASEHEHLTLWSTCDVCGKGKMRRGSATKNKWLKDEKQRLTDSMDFEMFIVCDNIDCEHYHKIEQWIVGRGGSISSVLRKSRPD
jgi:hypothetical protein